MSVQRGFFANAGGGAPVDNAPSSGNAASIESAYDLIPGSRVHADGLVDVRP
jgi:hypothetical protein